ncbi:uncharacterized protein LOC132543793 [Ylistrum balloti]|uniref:uncharacterized protein LOC132543793 n=1 Tax=Ylistrum balloti TaxID=509963 RepID=UPI002905BB4B|nr:uncharacterized protein LOC132543793 [Ylistrum balloti]
MVIYRTSIPRCPKVMASRQKLGKLILEEDEYRNKGWQTISLLDTDTRLGNFVWKRPRSFIIKVLWEKYISVKTDENLVEFLEECENQNFHFQTKSRTEPLSQTIWEKMIHASIDVDGVGASATDTIKRSNPIRELRITSLVRSELEKQLRSV